MRQQAKTSEAALSFWLFESELGGGTELVALVIISFVFCERPKFFYYLAVMGLDKCYVNFFKLAYHEPRPYMIEGDI
jgi:hypothetical protein